MKTSKKNQIESKKGHINFELDLGILAVKSMIEVSQNYYWQISKLSNQDEYLNGLNNLFYLLNQSQKEIETITSNIVKIMANDKEPME